MRSSAARMQDEATTIAARTAGQIMHVPVLWTPGSYPGSIARRNGDKKKMQQLRHCKASTRRLNIGEGKHRRRCPIPLPQPRPSRPECSPVVRDSRYLPCEEKFVHASEIFLPRGAFWQV